MARSRHSRKTWHRVSTSAVRLSFIVHRVWGRRLRLRTHMGAALIPIQTGRLTRVTHEQVAHYLPRRGGNILVSRMENWVPRLGLQVALAPSPLRRKQQVVLSRALTEGASCIEGHSRQVFIRRGRSILKYSSRHSQRLCPLIPTGIHSLQSLITNSPHTRKALIPDLVGISANHGSL
jgi:hypothetical protein